MGEHGGPVSADVIALITLSDAICQDALGLMPPAPRDGLRYLGRPRPFPSSPFVPDIIPQLMTTRPTKQLNLFFLRCPVALLIIFYCCLQLIFPLSAPWLLRLLFMNGRACMHACGPAGLPFPNPIRHFVH
jgi:hypothetical protein